MRQSSHLRVDTTKTRYLVNEKVTPSKSLKEGEPRIGTSKQPGNMLVKYEASSIPLLECIEVNNVKFAQSTTLCMGGLIRAFKSVCFVGLDIDLKKVLPATFEYLNIRFVIPPGVSHIAEAIWVCWLVGLEICVDLSLEVRDHSEGPYDEGKCTIPIPKPMFRHFFPSPIPSNNTRAVSFTVSLSKYDVHRSPIKMYSLMGRSHSIMTPVPSR